MRAWAWIIIVAIALTLLAWGGYRMYRFVVETPPGFLLAVATKTSQPPPLPLSEDLPLKVPEGFAISIFSRDVPGARVMIRDPKGALLVSLTKHGSVVALQDLDADGIAESKVTVLNALKQPHGLAMICDTTGNASADQDSCRLFVAEANALRSYRYDADTVSVYDMRLHAQLPNGGGHYTRTLLRHPDGKTLLISIGSSCNVCDEKDPQRATVQAYDLESESMTTFARGLRNTVFMATDPVDGSLWGTDNGRDLIGDDIPPDEVNIIERGGNYGWPICYGNKVHDIDYDRNHYVRDPCEDTRAPHIELPAHVAALGLSFVPEEGWPDGWGNDVLVAYHGSWNRSEPSGYKIVRFNLDSERNVTTAPTDFLAGFLSTNDPDDAIGRPVDILAEPGGVAFVSDDRAGAIYKITKTSAH